MRRILLLVFSFFLILVGWEAYGQVQTLSPTGTTQTFTVPAGVTSITVEVWGGGGRGGSRSSNGYGGGGGGGAYSRSVLAVTPGQVITYFVGFGSLSEQAGEDSWFLSNTTVMAKGGNTAPENSTTGAAGGAASAGYGTFTRSGGNGANANITTNPTFWGGGGGSSAGIAANGNNASSQNNGATAPIGGGSGGNGVRENQGQGRGTDGTAPGGGGGGSYRSNASGTLQVGGYGGNGQMRLSYIALTSATGTDNQAVCVTTPITSTTYTIPSGSTYTVTNLPAGLSQSISTNTITISGTPTASGTYTITATPSYFSSVPITLTRTGTVTVIPNNTVSSTIPDQTRCINTALTSITHTTTGATGISNNGIAGANGLPPGVSASWNAGVITISGTPTSSAGSPYNYSILLTGGCGTIYATGTITVTPDNTVTPTTPTDQTQCINTGLTDITFNTTGATGISNNGVAGANGLPAGVSATWAANKITISGTPTVSGVFNYSIPLTGGCGSVNAVGTITVTANNTAIPSGSASQSQCINEDIVDITFNTTGATGISNAGISGANGLPPGVSATWNAGVITISGTPTSTAGSPYNYSIPLTGGCGTIFATGTITVRPDNTVTPTTLTDQTRCINVALGNITFNTSGATGISNNGISGANGLPAGVSASWAGNIITISGTPTVAGTFNYSIPLLGGCNDLYAEGTITVDPATAITAQNMADQRICEGDTFNALSVTATGVGTLSYQWFSNDTPSKTGASPVGTNSNTYTPPSGTIGTKYYYVEVTSGCSPIATSSFSKATVEPITIITTEPDTSDDIECYGDGFDPLTVVAEGADLTYQWYSVSTQVNAGGTAIPGATSSSFTPPSTTLGIAYYYVVVSGYCSSDTSLVSGEYEVTPPQTTIVQHPSTLDQTVCLGDPLTTLTVEVDGEVDIIGSFEYQWYSNTSPSNTGGTKINGATSPDFTPPSNAVGTHYYYATGRSDCGTVPTNVSGAITVTQPSVVNIENLGAQEICEDQSFDPISIVADGTGTIEYQWYSNTSPVADTLGVGVIELTGETSDSFTPPTTLGPTLYYFVKVSSDCGPNVLSSVSGAFAVNPLPAPTFASEPTLPICVGQSATYVTQPGQSNYVWSGFGIQGTDYTITSGGLESSDNSVTVTWLTSGTKNVSVLYTDPNTCTAIVPATNSLTVNALPVPTFTAAPSAPICVGTTVTYTTQSGSGESNYLWTIPGVLGTDYAITSGGTSTSDPTVTITWLTSGTKDVSVSYTNSNGCTPTIPVTNSLTVNSLPVPSFVTSPDTEVCVQESITYTTQAGKSNYIWTVDGTLGTDYTISSGGTGTTSGTVTIDWLTTGSKTVTVSYTEPSTGCVATTSASSTTEVEPYATVGATSNPFPSVCISSPSLAPFTQPTTGVTGIGTPVGLPPGITASFNSATGNIEFSGTITGTSTGLYTYSIPLIGNCIYGLQATGTIDFTPNYELTSISAVSATVSGGSARIRINGNAATLPNGEYEVTYILDDGTPPPGEYTSNSFIVSNGTGVFPTIPLTDLDVEVYKITIKSIKKITDVCEVAQNVNDPDNIGYFSVCGATFNQNGTFTVPAGIYEITIQASGAGAAGQTDLITIPVTPGEPLGVFIGLSAGAGTARNTYVTRDSSSPSPQTTSLIYVNGGGGSGSNGEVIISYTCPDPNKDDCIEVIDDGAKSGTTVIRFNCDDQWDIPEGLVDFSVFAVGGGGGAGMGSTGGGGGGGGFTSTTVNSTNPYGIPAGNSLNIKIGQGGVGASTVNVKGGNGGNTTVSSTIPDPSGNINLNLNAQGGGGGGSYNNLNGNNGASGGGGAFSDQVTNTMGLGGTGIAGQGNSGGNGGKGNGANHARAGGGGGGAGGVGEVGDGAGVGLSKPGNGGSGASFALSGTTYGYGAGGGGIGYNFNGNTNSPGLGGSVNGVILGGTASDNGTGNDGTIYTGSGGGAGTLGGGKGGSGVVYITYLNYRILSVEYLHFDAQYNPTSRTGELTWATAKEWENSHFEIERSVDGIKNWTVVGQVSGAGYSEQPMEYAFQDLNLPLAGGNVFYRLRQVDFDGESSYSVTKSIQVAPVAGTTYWRVYPNPTNGEVVNLELLSKEVYHDEPVTLRIISSTGQFELIESEGNEALGILVSERLKTKAAGVYTLEIAWGANREYHKIILRR
jgi:hypothetical protein